MKSNIKENTIRKLEEFGRKNKIKLWKDVSERLKKPSRKKPTINLWKIGKLATEGKYLLVYGKILGTGDLDVPVNIIYNEISEKAKKKIEEKGGKTVFLVDALDIKPEKIVIVK